MNTMIEIRLMALQHFPVVQIGNVLFLHSDQEARHLHHRIKHLDQRYLMAAGDVVDVLFLSSRFSGELVGRPCMEEVEVVGA